MTQEDKELLLKDLCARLQYGVKIKLGNYDYQVIGYNPEKKELPLRIWYYYKKNSKSYIDVYLEDYQPYLRPMSSMTKEETKELFKEIGFEFTCNTCGIPAHYNYEFAEQIKGIPTITNVEFIKVIDWLNKNMFDYRGLIPMGLAIAVTEENNPYKVMKL